MKIKAAVLYETGKPRPYDESHPLQIEAVDLSAPGYNEVLVKIHAAGLCHSDLSVIDGSRARPLPMVLGHEASGEVMECGAGVSDLKQGDHVVFSFVPTCGHCMPCITGRPALCEPGAAANIKGALLSGGTRLTNKNLHHLHHHLGVSAFAEYVIASRRSLVKVDAALPYEISALFGCAVLTGVGAVINTARLTAGQTVLITGLGGVGLAAVLGALSGGAATVIAADINPQKRAMALQLGAHHVIDPADSNAVQQVKNLTGGGVDIALEFAGVIKALEFAYAATKRGGLTVTAGLPHPSKTFSLSPAVLVAEERTLKGSYLGSCIPSRDIPAFISLYQTGRLPVNKLLSHAIALEQINEGFERLAKGDVLRQIVSFA
ncbi:zinc-dependent alcohol dehydrogenase family protein [Agriterribacter sp.]|uniref:zinc-dependent alcohol dehydrogenase family protein n=1 Tax=Agriterribacter sp. TaxID=2821509 RepID=UPI002C5BD268|nr:zinc-dependent alcohol dehydrogenase family protein [Agriterribacter sp.]HRO46513.1 zinc-dependent alcohol dehydrogenase family protein [Agriterribacter sp.]HRQ17558.1 zinc-dependent alcohol dehydrogenase family protein [Agriterribacter sp.]